MTGRHGGNPWALVKPRSGSARRAPFVMSQRDIPHSASGLALPDLPRGFAITQVLDFSANLNPVGPPPGVESLLEEARGRIRWYPEPTYREFRESVAKAEGVDPSCILPGNGTADLIHLISRWKARGRVAVVVPTFTEYERAAQADQSEVFPLHLKEELDFFPDGLGREIGSLGAVQLLFLCNPNNPTGRLWPVKPLQELLGACQRAGTVVVVDEAYMEFLEDRLRYSSVPWVKRFQNLIVLRSMTKIFSVPGIRIGYGVTCEKTALALRQIQPPWPMNGLAASLGERLIGESGFLERSRREIAGFRQQLRTDLQGLPGIKLVPSEANFILCRLMDPAQTAQGLAQDLARRGILIRVCDDFTGLEPGRFIRVAVRRPEENQRLLQALQEILRHAG